MLKIESPATEAIEIVVIDTISFEGKQKRITLQMPIDLNLYILWLFRKKNSSLLFNSQRKDQSRIRHLLLLGCFYNSIKIYIDRMDLINYMQP